MINFVEQRRKFFGLSLVFVVGSIIALSVWGLPFGIDFVGGTLLEVKHTSEEVAVSELVDDFEVIGYEHVRIQPTGEDGLLVRMEDLTEEQHQEVLALLEENLPGVSEQRFESIGPVIGQELTRKAGIAIIVALVAILAYIAFAFRKIAYRLSSWKYGLIAMIALTHDILIPAGIFAFLGKFAGIEIDALFVTALLTILGFSIHDTIVVFDRVRENITRFRNRTFSEIVDRSIHETFARSVNTSITTLAVLLAVFFLGGDSVKFFALALAIGVAFGTYSSMFIASPLLVVWEGKSAKK